MLPDLVLLDVMMPSMSGYEVATRIREVWPSSLLPIIMVGADSIHASRCEGERWGCPDRIQGGTHPGGVALQPAAAHHHGGCWFHSDKLDSLIFFKF